MYLIGIDAGTTSVSGALLNTTTGTVERTVTAEHGATYPGNDPDTTLQDPSCILSAVEQTLAELGETAGQSPTGPGDRHSDRHSRGRGVAGVSLTGQVHGILYVDGDARPLSPLYTWQDSRGSRARPAPHPRTGSAHEVAGLSWSEWVEEVSGWRVPSGYGFLTHLINRHARVVPPGTAGLTTILGFLSMRLTRTTAARLEPTDAHTLGLFDLHTHRFDLDALHTIGVDTDLVPQVVPAGTVLGTTREGVPLYAAAGDNQAGFVGSVLHPDSTLLVNVGTSAQLSAYAPVVPPTKDTGGSPPGWDGELELRPFPGGGCLYTGASLAGGAAYRMLEQLFRDVCLRYAGHDPGPLLEQMTRTDPDSLEPDQRLEVATQFLGTRLDPSTRGRIAGISTANLTPDYLVEGFLRGVAREIAAFAGSLPPDVRSRAKSVVGVGNALRRNELLKKLVEEELGLPVRFPAAREEAAVGAAIMAGVGAGIYAGYTGGDRPLEYEG